MAFIELHARSAFSFLRATSQPEALLKQAAKLGMSSLAIVDRQGVYGSARAHAKARELGLQAFVGAEIVLEDGGALPLLAASREGYRNLCRMITTASLRSPKGEGRVSWHELAKHAAGLHALTGDEEGPLRRRLAQGDRQGAENTLRKLSRIFGPSRTWIELQRLGFRRERWEIAQLRDLASAHGLPVLASSGAVSTVPDERPLLDAFTCLRHHTTLDAAGNALTPNAERYLRSSSSMRERFADQPDALTNTQRLADSLEFTLENLGYRFPSYPCAPGETEAAVLRRETFRGARQRFRPLSTKIRRQLEHELDLIEKLGFCGYFLIVWQIIDFARQQNILCQGRGSAANSAVCYSLGITNVDPIGGNLLFERFLSEGRRSWPDIDIDFPSGERRESVIQEVFRRYAPRGAAMTANVITYRGRSAMREMGKVLGLPEELLKRFSEIGGSGDFPDTLELEERVRQSGLPDEHPRLPALTGLYGMAHGLPRHLGQHSGGMVISNQPLDGIVPLENASMPGRVVVQWDKDDCEDLGIVKVDLLGLGMLSAVQDTVTLCRERGRPVDLASLPKDDPQVYQLLQSADTIGLFQVESRAQMATLPRLKPREFYDIVIETAIIRPGPIVGKLVHPYINRRNGREPVDYIDERFKPVLERTLGIPLFQEQVLKMAMIIADFSGSEAEELRRAMSFHRSQERMQRVMGKLRRAMDQKGVSPGLQDRIVTAIRSFALYGFPESHAISFALIAYASAWLKVHRPAEFYTGLLNNQPMGFYHPPTLIKDAKDHGVRVHPVSVLRSGVDCTVEADDAIRLGLASVKGLARASAEAIVHARNQAAFTGLADFLLRTRLPKDEKRLLAQSGALNGLAEHRRAALWQAELPFDDGDLFQRASSPDSAASLPPMNAPDRLAADYETLGLTTGPHPMRYVREQFPDLWRAGDLPQAPHGTHLWIGGVVICRQRPGTAKGHVFISLEDETGIANAFVPAETFERYRLTITQEGFLRIRGRVQNPDGVISVYAHHLEPLPFEAAIHPKSHDFH